MTDAAKPNIYCKGDITDNWDEICDSVLIYVAHESMDHCSRLKGHEPPHRYVSEWTDGDAQAAHDAWR